MINSKELVDMFSNDKKSVKVQYGRIDPGYISGKPKIVFDTSIDTNGNGVASAKEYPYLESYTPTASDRVMILNGVIIGRIVT